MSGGPETSPKTRNLVTKKCPSCYCSVNTNMSTGSDRTPLYHFHPSSSSGPSSDNRLRIVISYPRTWFHHYTFIFLHLPKSSVTLHFNHPLSHTPHLLSLDRSYFGSEQVKKLKLHNASSS